MRITEITCISDLYYVIGRWFTIAMVALAFATMPFALNAWDSVFSFAVCAGIAFVGVASAYRDKFVYPVHIIAAAVSAICSIAWVVFICPINLCVLAVALVGIADRKRWLLWCEIPCFVMFYWTLITR